MGVVVRRVRNAPQNKRVLFFIRRNSCIRAWLLLWTYGWRGIDSETMRLEEVRKEPHYAKAGYIVGTLLRIAILVMLARTF